MTDLYLTREDGIYRICKRNEQGRQQVVATAINMKYARLFAQAEKMKEALEDYAKPQRWLRAYQPTGELGLTRCVFTGAGHGFELAQEALSALMHHDQHSQYANPNRVASDYADRLDDIIRKYEEPTDAMLDAGTEAFIRAYWEEEKSRKGSVRACFKAMIEAEDQDHE